MEVACFRVAQEALTNVVRHARAANVFVQVEQHSGGVHLTVSDDGAGFEVEAALERASRGLSLGLLNMRERAELAGGTIAWTSEPGRRTSVDAWVAR